MNFLMGNARVLIDQVRKGVFSSHLFDPSTMPSELLSHISPTEYAESVQRLNTAAKNHPKLALGIYVLARVTTVASLVAFIYFCWAWRTDYDSDGYYYSYSNRLTMIYTVYTFWVALVIRIVAGLHLATRRRQRLARAVAAEHGIYMNRFPQSSWRIAHNHHRIATLEIEKHCPIVPPAQPQVQILQQPQMQPAVVQMPSAPDMTVNYAINDARRYPSINQPLLPVYHQV